MSLPERMRAMRIRGFGGTEVFEQVDLARPTPMAGEVLIRVAATSVNPADLKIRRHGGSLAPASGVLGMDVAGTVVAVGVGVREWSVGDAVFGCAGGLGPLQGALAEYLSADARLLARAPARIPLREAAALPLVAITAYEALFDRARIQRGQRLLLLGALGGVGHVALQLAVEQGVQVTAVVSSSQRAQLARELGASTVVIRDGGALTEAAADAGQGYDVVFDASGQDHFADCFALVRPQGQVISLVTRQQVDLTPMHAKGLSLHAVFMLVPMIHGLGRERHGQILAEVARRIDAGTLRVLIDPRSHPMSDVGSAHARMEAGHVLGKLLIDVPD